MLHRDFYMRDANVVAPELLGKSLVHVTPEGTASGVIVEVEAYKGDCDKGAHSYRNKNTPRTEIQFHPGGYAYVFTIYGLHCCMNVVTNEAGVPDVVLIRALMPLDGVELMQARRGTLDVLSLCSGPGKLCASLGITKADYGRDLCQGSFYIEEHMHVPKERILVSPRVNIDYAEECRDLPWRYYIKDCEYVSRVPKKYEGRALTE